MTEPDQPDQPNEYGFAGGATTPSPARTEDRQHTDAEDLAVPSGDLTGSISDGIDEVTHAGDARDADPR